MSTSPSGLELALESRIAELERLHQVVVEFAQQHSLPDQIRFAIDLSLEEIVTNVMCYGMRDQEKPQIVIRLRHQEGELLAEVEDNGCPFNPFSRPDPDTTLALEDRPIGGLGVYLVRNLMDEVHYVRNADHNLITMTKRIRAT